MASRFTPLLFRTGLVHEHDAAVEIALLAGERFIDRVGDDVGDAPPIVRRCEVLFAVELLAGKNVPQPELGFEPPIALPGNAAGDQRLRTDHPPIGETRDRIAVGDPLDEGLRIDRREQPAALEIVGDDGGDVVGGFALAGRARQEIRHRNRHRLDIALGDVEAQHRVGRTGRERGKRTSANAGEQTAAIE